MDYFELTKHGGARYLRPIETQSLCLACHESDVAPDVGQAVVAQYPQDYASGFSVSGLRGVFVVEWSRRW